MKPYISVFFAGKMQVQVEIGSALAKTDFDSLGMPFLAIAIGETKPAISLHSHCQLVLPLGRPGTGFPLAGSATFPTGNAPLQRNEIPLIQGADQSGITRFGLGKIDVEIHCPSSLMNDNRERSRRATYDLFLLPVERLKVGVKMEVMIRRGASPIQPITYFAGSIKQLA